RVPNALAGSDSIRLLGTRNALRERRSVSHPDVSPATAGSDGGAAPAGGDDSRQQDGSIPSRAYQRHLGAGSRHRRTARRRRGRSGRPERHVHRSIASLAPGRLDPRPDLDDDHFDHLHHDHHDADADNVDQHYINNNDDPHVVDDDDHFDDDQQHYDDDGHR